MNNEQIPQTGTGQEEYNPWQRMANEVLAERSGDTEQAGSDTERVSNNSINEVQPSPEVPAAVETDSYVSEEDRQVHEYAERAKESRDFLIQCFTNTDDPKRNEYNLGYIDEFVEGKRFQTLIAHGISIEDLARANFISIDIPKDAINPIVESEIEAVVGDIDTMYRCQESAISGRMVGDRDFNTERYAKIVNTFENILEKRKNGEELTRDDYESMAISKGDAKYSYIFPGMLRRRIWFGDLYDPQDQMDKTLHALEHCVDHSTDLHVLTMQDLNMGILKDDEDGTMRKKLIEVCQRDFEQHLQALGGVDESLHSASRSDIKDLILRSSDTAAICLFHDKMNAAKISDEEMLQAAYCTPFDKKLVSYSTPDYYLGRHAEALTKSGFSSEAIVNVLHDNEIAVGDEAIDEMRNAGISDTDIAYSCRAYMMYGGADIAPSPIETTAIGRANFSDKDLLTAAVRELKKNQKNNKRQ